MKKGLTVRAAVVVAIVILVTAAGVSLKSTARATGAVQDQAKAGEPAFNQEQALAELRRLLAGKENKPGEEAFKNIQLLKGMPAGRLLRIMETGFSRSLGVNCTHCHVAGEWEKEDKPTKQITRDMWKMMNAINAEHPKNIKNLKGPNPAVNCTTCHRGETKPAVALPNTKGG